MKGQAMIEKKPCRNEVKMKNIVLICAAGMSTSLLVKRMEKAAAETGYECKIAAYPAAEGPSVIPGADVVMLGPQVKYMLSKWKKQYPEKIIEAIDVRIYGMVDGAKALEQAQKAMGQ
ncbi:PTS system cellobiose-specific EIIB component [Muribaculaceae bacterium]|nr:PTS system cellobiose-specific EIIB component [Muribaculaceae bacterium]